MSPYAGGGGYPQGAGSPHAQFAPTGGMPGSPAMHYGEAPRRQPRRYKTSKCIEKTDRFGATIEKLTFFFWSCFQNTKTTAKKVKLTRGNLVLDCPVPTRYLQAVPIKDTKEFTHMRYTAATCDPKDFASSGYTLRQQLLNRETELFIVLTMYNVRRKWKGETGCNMAKLMPLRKMKSCLPELCTVS